MMDEQQGLLEEPGGDWFNRTENGIAALKKELLCCSLCSCMAVLQFPHAEPCRVASILL